MRHESHIDALAPYARCQTIDCVIGKLDSFTGRAESHRSQHRAENLLLRDDRRGMHITEQRRRIVEPARGQFNLWLPASCSLRNTLVDKPLDAVELHPVQRSRRCRSICRAEAPARRVLMRSRTFAMSGSAMLSCISRREPAQQTCPWLNQMPSTRPSTALSRSASSKMMNGDFPPSSSDSLLWLVAVALRIARPTSVEPVNAIFATSGCFTRASPVEPSPVTMLTTPGWQAHFLANFGEGQRGQRRELRGFEDDCIAGGQRRRNFPGQHQQRKVPRNDLPDHAAGGVSGKFLLQQLCPSGMVIEVANHKRNVDVTALADGLAVVDCFENGQASRVFLMVRAKA